ncbi:ABC transporter substrate-binding protein [Nonomuraea sp. NPDC049269]|uniref:ABC transporter substrate-binding protein n=1 Tax=Nonomuraea sp. NPDC049269 TaxID=3364349 RepID=UPI003710DA6D
MAHRFALGGRRVHLLTATVLVAVLSLSSCGTVAISQSSDPVSGGTLNVLRRNPFEGFELDKESLNSTFQISQAVLEPLLRSSADGRSLVPGLAKAWRYNAANTVLTVELDPSATFSDGRPVTADDVAFSVGVWKSGVNYGATYRVIKSTKVVDSRTVELHLANPDTTLPAFLSWAAAGVLPKDFGGKPAKEFWQHPVGAGPFAVEKWSTEGEVVLARNKHYYRAKRPYLDKVVSQYAADPNSVGPQLLSGQADMAEELLPVTASTLPKDQVDSAEPHLTKVLLINTKIPGLSDVHVRRAIGYAIDYQAILKSAFRGYGDEPNGALPANTGNWAAPSKPYFRHDEGQATQELNQAATKPAKLTLSYPNDPSSTLIAQIVQDNLKSIGITVELQAGDPGNSYATISSGKYQLGIFSYNAISPDISDPAVYVAATSGMFTGWDGGALFKLIGKYAGTADAAAKKTEVTAMQDLLADQAMFIALNQGSSIMGVRPVVHGLEQLPWSAYYLDGIWKTS